MMLDLIKCIKLLPVQNKYPATRFICQNFKKNWYIDNQVAIEIKRNIWKYLVYLVCITYFPISLMYYLSSDQVASY